MNMKQTPAKIRAHFVSVCGTCLCSAYDVTPCNATPLDVKNNPISVALETPSMESMEAHLSASYLTQVLENSINLHICNYHLHECKISSIWSLLQSKIQSQPSADTQCQSYSARHLKPGDRSCSSLGSQAWARCHLHRKIASRQNKKYLEF